MVQTSCLAMAVAVLVIVGTPAPAATGKIAGRVRYLGRVPPPLIVFEGGGQSEQKVLHVDPASQGLRFAVVSIDAPAEAPAKDAPLVTIDQAGWMFVPPVIAVRAGQPVRFTNGDGANHNVRSNDEQVGNRLNEMTSTSSYTHRFEARADPGAPVAITCDIHAWMIAWVYVFDHARYAVTDAHGRFEIGPMPAGDHRLHVRQPSGGLARDVDVRVPAAGVAEMEITFGTSDLRPWKPRWPSQDTP